MKVLLVLFASAFFINVNAQKMKEYKIEIAVKASKEKVWEVITNFENYPSWNSVLKMESNNNLIVGNKFKVTITQPNGKSSNFKAKVDKPGKVTHLRRMKLTRVNELPRFDLSLG